jgi:fructosamine-3-kinase
VSDLADLNVREGQLREQIDPYLTDATLSGLATRALGARTRCSGFRVLTGGMWNRVIAVQPAGAAPPLVVKITPEVGDATLKREFAALRFFRDRTPLPVPEPLLLDLSGERVPGSVLVMEQLPGRVLSAIAGELSAEERATIAEDIAAVLAELHTVREPGFGGVELPPEERRATWAGFWLARFDYEVAKTGERGLLQDGLLDEIAALRDGLGPLLDIGPLGSPTHYDIWSGNVMVDERDGRPAVTGFLDPLGYWADTAREISSMGGLAGERFMAAYRRRHPTDATFDARVSLYSLKMGLQLVCIYPDDPRRVEHVRGYLREVQAALG